MSSNTNPPSVVNWANTTINNPQPLKSFQNTQAYPPVCPTPSATIPANQTSFTMNRRHFFLRFAALIPVPALAGKWLDHLPGRRTKLLPHEQLDLPFDWFTLPRLPVRSAESALARSINNAIARGTVVRFRYHSGSAPGTIRKVIPSLLFRLDGYAHLYLTAHCSKRQAHRTFRLDRCEGIKVMVSRGRFENRRDIL